MKLAIATVAAACLLVASSASADVQVTMHDGRVSIIAKDATLRQIMSEWARVGQTKIVNVERIPGGPVTLELRDVTEDQALEILMRPLSGYLAAPRPATMPNLSKFDRILVMPTVAAARAATTATSAPSNGPVYQTQPAPSPVFQASPQANGGAADDNEPQVENTGAPRAPVFTAFPQPQVVNPAAAQGGVYVPPPGMGIAGGGAMPPVQSGVPATPGPAPTAPVGVAVPGMMVPAQQQP